MEPSASFALDWESRYRENRAPWERSDLHPAFVDWRASGALTPCRILVPGAGRSPEPAALAKGGFTVTVLDAAASAIALQRERLADRGEAIEVDLFAWEPLQVIDAIYDQTCLCALPPPLWPEYGLRLHRWLRPGGTLFVLFMTRDTEGGPPFHCGMDAMRQLFAPPRWRWPDTLAAPVPHPSGIGVEQPAGLTRI